MKTAIVLAGHGSHISAETAGIVWAQVDALRALHAADEVTAAFWKEQPSFHTVFDSLAADDITVVPLFTAQGYFTQTLIPTEMELTGAVTQRNGRVIRYTRTLSEHPYLGEIVRRRVTDSLRLLDTPPEQTAVAIVGHSTRRNPESRRATEAQAEAIRQSSLVTEVVAVYLDDTPAIADVYTLTHAPTLIVIPYFLASGSHTTIDVPRELELDTPHLNEATTINERTVFYTQPVGVEAELQAAVLELITDAQQPIVGERLKPSRLPSLSVSSWDCFPAAALPYVEQLMATTPFTIGQLQVTANEVRHVDDDQPTDTLTTPAALRTRVRENPFRPLATSTDLPRSWRVPTDGDPQRVLAIIETVYPGVLGSHLTAKGSLDALLNRQTGRYRDLLSLRESAYKQVMEEVCGSCVRQPVWATNDLTADQLACPEPCDFWLSAALKHLKGSEAT